VIWSNDPERWKPINHSCDPNAWLDGLNLTARHKIAAGEQITIDYATFCNESLEEFTCSCGSPDCRGIIRGTDYRKSFLERYGDHVSDYVRTHRRR
jgi:D-alanine-D-alanine ligase